MSEESKKDFESASERAFRETVDEIFGEGHMHPVSVYERILNGDPTKLPSGVNPVGGGE